MIWIRFNPFARLKTLFPSFRVTFLTYQPKTLLNGIESAKSHRKITKISLCAEKTAFFAVLNRIFMKKWSQSLLGILAFLLVASQKTQAAPGDLDTSFGVNGVMIQNIKDHKEVNDGFRFNERGFGDVVAAKLQPDNKMLVLGYSSEGVKLMRYLSRGTLDPSFGNNGIVTDLVERPDYYFAVPASSLEIQSSGKIIVGIVRTNFYNPGAGILIRYDTSGSARNFVSGVSFH